MKASNWIIFEVQYVFVHLIYCKGILKELISLIQSLIKFKSLWKTVKKTARRVEQTCTIKKLYKSKSLQSRMQVNKVIMSNRDTQAKIGQNSIEGSYLSRSSKNVFDVHVNNRRYVFPSWCKVATNKRFLRAGRSSLQHESVLTLWEESASRVALAVRLFNNYIERTCSKFHDALLIIN